MPERQEDVMGYELQSLLGRGHEKSAAADIVTATVGSAQGQPPHGEHHNVIIAVIHLQVSVIGMHCSSCSTAVERALRYIALSTLYG